MPPGTEPPLTHRSEIEADQLARLRRLLSALVPRNAFYSQRLIASGLVGSGDVGQLQSLPQSVPQSVPQSLEVFRRRMPRTTKAELMEDQLRHPPYGSNLTYPLEAYTRCHQTSGTTGRPMTWLDTPESWRWMVATWRRVFVAAGIGPRDRVLFPFSFGPFLGFWTAFDAAESLGCMTLAGGGLSSSARLELMHRLQATAVCLTPTYALRLGEVARDDPALAGAVAAVKTLVVAGEPGGSLPSTRAAIEALWPQARVFDHHGMTEVGPVSYPNPRHPDLLHILESAYLAEILDPENGEAVPPGELGELTLTTLGRTGSPLLRYRTGDLVRQSLRSPTELGSADLALEGGILTRLDDMVVVRGVNLYPAAVEAVLRRDPRVAEYRVEHHSTESLAEVRVRVEPTPDHADNESLRQDLAQALKDRFQLRMAVVVEAPGSLPRFEMKAQRWASMD